MEAQAGEGETSLPIGERGYERMNEYEPAVMEEVPNRELGGARSKWKGWRKSPDFVLEKKED